MLTDSGGFQVFSLAGCRKLKEEGCHFQSHIDGSRHLFTPESVIDTERTIGADIMMAFDECPPGDSPRDYAAKSLALTERWLDRCFNRYRQTSLISVAIVTVWKSIGYYSLIIIAGLQALPSGRSV